MSVGHSSCCLANCTLFLWRLLYSVVMASRILPSPSSWSCRNPRLLLADSFGCSDSENSLAPSIFHPSAHIPGKSAPIVSFHQQRKSSIATLLEEMRKMNRFLSKGILALGALFTLCLVGTDARADEFLIVPVAPRVIQPAGLGTVNTVLVIQSHGSSINASGSVAYGPNDPRANRRGDVVIGNQIVGGSNNQTYSVTDLNLVNGNLCINMNINDPNTGGGNGGPLGAVVLNTL